MRKSGYAILFVALVLAFSCDTPQDALEESLPEFYILSTQVSPEDGGSIEPENGEYLAGDSLEVEAIAAEGYVFEQWEGDLSGNTNPAMIQLNSNSTVTAQFSLKDYHLNIDIEGSGTVREVVVERSASVTVRLEAEADEGWNFDRWEGDLSGSSNPETLIIEEDDEKNVTAIFEQDESDDEYSLSIKTEGEGSVEKDPDQDSYTDGEEVTLTANPASGWSFAEWQGDLSGNDNPETITLIEDKEVTAVFEQDAEMGITIQEVKLFIEEMALEGARQTSDFETNKFILNLPLDGTPFNITHVSLPEGYYSELELEIEQPDNSVNIGDSDFRDGSRSYSLVVNGIFNGADFTFQSAEDFEIEVDIAPHLEIESGQTSVIAIDVDIEDWFRGENDELLDPNDSGNAERINENIEDSFSDFEDNF